MSFTDRETARLAAMRALIARWGPETFVTAPMIEPTDAFFPDPYTPDLRGVRDVARRLLDYAGLGELEVEVTGPFGRNASDQPTEIGLSEIDTRTIGLVVESLGESQQSDVPLVLAREVARAYRTLRATPGHGAHPYREVALHGDEEDGEDEDGDDEDDGGGEDEAADTEEEHEVALTACYLGFGVLVVKGAEMDGGISPEEACFQLAAQAVARGSVEPARAWARQLRSGHAALLTRALDRLTGREAELAEALGLPPRDEWPPARSAPIERLPFDGWKPEDDPFASAPRPERVVYRRHRDHALHAAAAATVASGIGLAFLGDVHPTLTTWAWIAAPIAIAIAYLAGGRRRQRDACSGCAATLGEDSFCPRCGGILLGEMRRGETIADAEERAGIPTFGAREEALAHRMEAALARGNGCPHCEFRHHGEPHWSCASCETEPFDAFETDGLCPSCRAPLEEVRCPRCARVSAYGLWCP